MNPYDEWGNQRGFKGATQNYKGTLSDVAVDVTVSIGGWYSISADVDFYWAGPSSSSPTADSTCKHEWAKDTRLIYVTAGNIITMIRVATSGNYYIGKYQD
jgi:hypothetical protein